MTDQSKNININGDIENPVFVAHEKTRLYAAAVRLAYQQSALALFAAFLNMIVLAIVLVRVVPSLDIILWIFASTLLTVFRFFSIHSYFKTNPDDHHSIRWGKYFLTMTFLSGMIWGSAGIFLFPTESTAHQIFMILVVGGISAGAVATYASIKWAVPILTTAAMSPLFFRVLLTRQDLHYMTALLILVFMAVVFVSSFRVHKTTITSLKLRLENTSLIANLEQEKIWVEQLNEELKDEIEERKTTEEEKEKLITELQAALEEIQTLGGLLPICTTCKKIRNDQGFWTQVEEYITEHSSAKFSHSMCPNCLDELYPDHKKWREKADEKRRENNKKHDNNNIT